MGVHLGGLNGGEVVVELVLLGWCHFYTDGANRLQELVKGIELLTQNTEVIIQCNITSRAEYIMPLSFCIEVIEEETAEETAFCILNECAHLLRCTCKKC